MAEHLHICTIHPISRKLGIQCKCYYFYIVKSCTIHDKNRTYTTFYSRTFRNSFVHRKFAPLQRCIAIFITCYTSPVSIVVIILNRHYLAKTAFFASVRTTERCNATTSDNPRQTHLTSNAVCVDVSVPIIKTVGQGKGDYWSMKLQWLSKLSLWYLYVCPVTLVYSNNKREEHSFLDLFNFICIARCPQSDRLCIIISARTQLFLKIRHSQSPQSIEPTGPATYLATTVFLSVLLDLV